MADNIDLDTVSGAFTRPLLNWYASNKRDLPWRQTNNPYLIWLSEIILQQTRIDQGMAYYQRFAEAFPDVASLAGAPEDQVMKLWQGLGYYSRARNLHAAAKMVQSEFNGLFPDDYKQMIRLPGVGPYTAAAVVSIAYGKPHAVVDGNVYRLLSRWFGIATPIDSTAGQKEFSALASALIPGNRPGDFNQAMMDFGSMVCKPLAPLCNNCPLAAGCHAFKEQQISSYPAKAGKTKIRNRYMLYVVPIDHAGNTLVRKRIENDIWQGLYEFPVIEYDQIHAFENFSKSPEFNKLHLGEEPIVEAVSQVKYHQLSHRKLHLLFAHVRVSNLRTDGLFLVKKLSELPSVAMPRALTRYIEEIGLI
jgi:A/G-specific adenine glycosylase